MELNMTALEMHHAALALRDAANLLRDGESGAEQKHRTHWWTIECAIGAVPYSHPGKRLAERFLYAEGGNTYCGLDERVNETYPWPQFSVMSSPECKVIQKLKQAHRYQLLMNYAEMLEAASVEACMEEAFAA